MISSPVAASTVTIGTTGIVASKTLPLNFRSYELPSYAADVTGTINYTVNETLDKIPDLTNPSSDASWFPLTALTSKTADLFVDGTLHATACQLLVNSYSSGADIQFTVFQNEAI